ncbi:MAG: GRP family sugar transporter, partial [Candidatus Nanohaloarchaea archaeon]
PDIVPNGLSSGVMWNVGNIGSLFAVRNLGVSIGQPLTQNAILVAVLWGIFYFNEETRRSRIRTVVIGGLVLIAGSAILSAAS